MKLVSVSQMHEIEKEANSRGLSYEKMIQNAGEGLAKIIFDEFKDDVHMLYAVGLVGSGKNGGDTLVALAALIEAGWTASVYFLGARPADDPLVKKLVDRNIQLVQSDQDPQYEVLDELISQADVLLDGILGTGFTLPLRPEIAAALGHISAMDALPAVVAVDCPSGVDCDSGECAPEAIPADFTVCMAAVKQGLLRFPAFEKVGRLETVDIGLADDLPAWNQVQYRVISQDIAAAALPPRPMTAHKGTFGTALIVAGSINYTGAAYLAAKAACRIGTGLVRLAVPGPLHMALAGHLPEVTWLILPHELGVISEAAADVLMKNLDKADAMLLGPGFGLEMTTGAFMKRILVGKIMKSARGPIGFLSNPETTTGDNDSKSKLPALVIDADGLKLLASIPDWPKRLPENSILTPHPGEMAVLTGLKVEEIQANRLDTAVRFAEEWGHVVVLKGALTVIAVPGQGASVVPVATAALAHAGTGDVLSGIITGLLAQGVAPAAAAETGAWIHAQAGLEAEALLETSASVLASDVLESIPTILHFLS